MIKRFLFFILSLLAALAACTPAMAAEEQEHPYQIRIYAGGQGTVQGEDYVEYTLTPGAQFVFDPGMVSVSNGKYYVLGIRESGKDNELADSAFTVRRDQDYVVAYGIAKNQVAFTVNYVTEDGTKLMPSSTYYGNIGDKPVVAFRYISGYRPQAYNITKTLSKDAKKNVFDVVYTVVAQEESGTQGDGSQNEAQGDGTGVVPATQADPTAVSPDEQTPTGLLDLDSTPRSLDEGVAILLTGLSQLHPALKVIIGGGASVLLILFFWFLFFALPAKRRERSTRIEEEFWSQWRQ